MKLLHIISPILALTHNAFYTAICCLSGTLPPSFIPKENCMLALIFMKQIENQYESVCSTTQLDGVVKPN